MKINHVDFKVDLLILARTTKYEKTSEKSKPRCYMKFHENTNPLSVHDKESFKRFSHKLTYYKSYCPDYTKLRSIRECILIPRLEYCTKRIF